MQQRFFHKFSLTERQFRLKRCFSEKSFCPADLFGKLGIVGVPFGKGQKKKGKDEAGLKNAPDIIRKTGFVDTLNCIGVDVNDYGNVKYEEECDLLQPNMHNLDHFAPCAKAVSHSVEKVLRECRSCLVLGGDHSIAVGSIHAHLKVADPRKVALIYVDAHADINTNKTSPSGNLHGMIVALLSQEMRNSWPESFVPGLDWMTRCLSLRNVAYIGTRSVDFGEVKFLNKNRVAVYGIDDVDKYGIQRVLCEALEQIDPSRNKSIHVSFDIDALDCFEAPCTTIPAHLRGKQDAETLQKSLKANAFEWNDNVLPDQAALIPPVRPMIRMTVSAEVRGGLTLREGISIAELLYQTGRLSVMDLVEVNPAIGDETQKQITLDAAKAIVLALCGYRRRGNEKIKN